MHIHWEDNKLSDLLPGTIFEHKNELYMVLKTYENNRYQKDLAYKAMLDTQIVCAALQHGELRVIHACTTVKKWGHIAGMSIDRHDYL